MYTRSPIITKNRKEPQTFFFSSSSSSVLSVSSLQPGNEVNWGGEAVYIPHEQTIEFTVSVTYNQIQGTTKKKKRLIQKKDRETVT